MNEICNNSNNNNDDIIKFTLTFITFQWRCFTLSIPSCLLTPFGFSPQWDRSSSRVHRATVHKMAAVCHNIHAMTVVTEDCHLLSCCHIKFITYMSTSCVDSVLFPLLFCLCHSTGLSRNHRLNYTTRVATVNIK